MIPPFPPFVYTFTHPSVSWNKVNDNFDETLWACEKTIIDKRWLNVSISFFDAGVQFPRIQAPMRIYLLLPSAYPSNPPYKLRERQFKERHHSLLRRAQNLGMAARSFGVPGSQNMYAFTKSPSPMTKGQERWCIGSTDVWYPSVVKTPPVMHTKGGCYKHLTFVHTIAMHQV